MGARERERDRDSKAVVRKRKRAGNPWWKDRAGICEGVPITFRIGDSPYILRIERPRSSAVSTTHFPCKCMYVRNLILIPRGSKIEEGIGRVSGYSPGTEKEKRV